jgi:hypothetical protein
MFAAPLALLALALLPPLYLILRLIPPPARRLRFPPIALLQNLPLTQTSAVRLPLWLLLLRLGTAALLIIGFAGPTLRPPALLPGAGPVLLVIDNSWAAAGIWPDMMETATTLSAAAARQHRAVAILTTAPARTLAPEPAPVMDAAAAAQRLAALSPEPWPADRAAAAAALRAAPETTRIYLADGITDGAGFPAFLAALHPSRNYAPLGPPALLGSVTLAAGGTLRVTAITNPRNLAVQALSAGGGVIALAPFDAHGAASVTLPRPIANGIAKFVLSGPATAGGTLLTDTATRATLAGLVTAGASADTPYLGTLYYLRRALPAGTDIRTGTLRQLADAHTGLIFLADTPLDAQNLAIAQNVLAAGGTLIRFAGPLTAAAPDALNADPLLAGDRRLGGALSWTTPESLAPMPAAGPLAGLPADPAIRVARQILVDPLAVDPATIWASLRDGTPLIIGRSFGQGTLVNILTTANTSWSNLSLSVLFPAILARLASLAHGATPNATTAWSLQQELDAFGTLQPPAAAASISPAALENARASPATPPGLYVRTGDAGGATIALNLGFHVPPPVPSALPDRTPYGGLAAPRSLGPDLITLAALLLALDLALSLRLRGSLRRRGTRAILPALFLLLLPAPPATAQTSSQSAALQTELGYLETGDQASDQITADALAYLSAMVSARTSVQLGPPAGLNPATDDLSLYPLLYWRLPAGTPAPSPAACTALLNYMQHGGLLVIDTPGGTPAAAGSGAGFDPDAATSLARATACLSLPPLEPLATANVLARSFYIIRGFPGRFTGAPVLIATPAARDADGVTPVIIGENDWAGAWARDATGAPEQTPLPDGEDQRVIADRFGINLVIYALTGSYKADQNTAPAFLDRLGQ